MKLSQLARKPQLQQIIIDDAETIERFGEPLEFYTWDRQPMDVFIKMAAVDSSNYASVIGTVRTLVLDEEGKEILTDDVMLPTSVLMRVISKVVEGLGK